MEETKQPKPETVKGLEGIGIHLCELCGKVKSGPGNHKACEDYENMIADVKPEFGVKGEEKS